MKKHAVMVYLLKDDKICFLVRDKANDIVHTQGKLLSIGGKVEPGESIEDCARREAREEAGIRLNEINLKAIMYFRKFGQEQNDWITYLFTCEDFSGEPSPGNEGSFVWEDRKNIDTLNVYSQDKLYLKLVFKHAFFAAEFLCDGQEMVEYKLLKAV